MEDKFDGRLNVNVRSRPAIFLDLGANELFIPYVRSYFFFLFLPLNSSSAAFPLASLRVVPRADHSIKSIWGERRSFTRRDESKSRSLKDINQMKPRLSWIRGCIISDEIFQRPMRGHTFDSCFLFLLYFRWTRRCREIPSERTSDHPITRRVTLR